jgi:hypothetical protein
MAVTSPRSPRGGAADLGARRAGGDRPEVVEGLQNGAEVIQRVERTAGISRIGALVELDPFREGLRIC